MLKKNKKFIRIEYKNNELETTISLKNQKIEKLKNKFSQYKPEIMEDLLLQLNEKNEKLNSDKPEYLIQIESLKNSNDEKDEIIKNLKENIKKYDL